MTVREWPERIRNSCNIPFQLVVDTFENLVRCRLVDRSPGLCHVSPWGRDGGLVNFLEEGSRALFLTRHYKFKGSRQRCAEGGSSWSPWSPVMRILEIRKRSGLSNLFTALFAKCFFGILHFAISYNCKQVS